MPPQVSKQLAAHASTWGFLPSEMLLPTGSVAMGKFLRHEISRGFAIKALILIRNFMVFLGYPNSRDPTFRHTRTLSTFYRVLQSCSGVGELYGITGEDIDIFFTLLSHINRLSDESEFPGVGFLEKFVCYTIQQARSDMYLIDDIFSPWRRSFSLVISILDKQLEDHDGSPGREGFLEDLCERFTATLPHLPALDWHLANMYSIPCNEPEDRREGNGQLGASPRTTAPSVHAEDNLV